MHRILISIMFAASLLSSIALADSDRNKRVTTVLQTVESLCPLPDLSGLDAQLAVADSWLIEEKRQPRAGPVRRIVVTLLLPDADELMIERRQHNGKLRQFRVSYGVNHGTEVQPNLLAIVDGACKVQSGREIRSDGPVWRFLDQLEGDLSTLRWTETLQAPWPEGPSKGGVRVGLIDSGLAYDLPQFADRMARRSDGSPVGYDFWDMDPWPYDGDISRGPFLPIRHGTAVASILAREAPLADLVPYRYPRPDMARMGDIVAAASASGVRVLAMPLGSRNKDDWATFEAALAEHDILAVVSAGNDGRDIDREPIYPASSGSERVLTVTSSTVFGRLAAGSNWGAQSVDIMVPAENLDIVDFRGASGVASGSSYAVPRVAAMAARLLEQESELSAMQLKARILDRATESPFERDGVVAFGWIPNPLDD